MPLNHALLQTRRGVVVYNPDHPSVFRSGTATEDGCAGSLSLHR